MNCVVCKKKKPGNIQHNRPLGEQHQKKTKLPEPSEDNELDNWRVCQMLLKEKKKEKNAVERNPE